MPFFQKQLGKWQGEIKILKKKGKNFCLYSQRKYQKECEKNRQLVGKYNSNCQKETDKTKNQDIVSIHKDKRDIIKYIFD